MTTKRKYAAIGEKVRIITPKHFIRCGYPLSIKDIMRDEFKEIEADFERMFAALENRSAPVQPTPSVDPDDLFGILSVTEQFTCSPTVHGMLCAAIAAYRLEQKNFGGGDRIIVEGEGLFEKGHVWEVVSKKFVKTGKRYGSYCGQDRYTGEWDYEPGGLEGEQTHCVYTLASFPCQGQILAAHCEIVGRESEKPLDTIPVEV